MVAGLVRSVIDITSAAFVSRNTLVLPGLGELVGCRLINERTVLVRESELDVRFVLIDYEMISLEYSRLKVS